MRKRLAKFVDYQQNPALLLLVYVWVMGDKVVRCLIVKDYKPKRLYF
jgi:hypothetical protein